MEITKHFRIPVECETILVEGILDDNIIDTDYFIEKINLGIHDKNNMTGKTNVGGGMTSWRYFIKDEKFANILRVIFNNMPPCDLPDLDLREAWGIKMEPGHGTKVHHHDVGFSGIIYLNDCDVPLQFPQIKIKTLPKKNKFLFFSGHLLHGTEPLTKGERYALPFNMLTKKSWD